MQLLIVFGAGLFVIKLAAPGILGQASFGPDAIIALTNAKRAENGLPPVANNESLASAASGKAANMLSENYWSHNSPSGKTPWSFITASGYRYLYAGENLARDFSDAGSLVSAWMDSPSHKSNLLDKNFNEIGVAVTWGNLTGREGTLVVQMFGTRLSQVPTQPTVVQATPAPSAQPEVKTSPRVAAGVAPSPTPVSSPQVTPAVSPQLAVDSPPVGGREPAGDNQTTVLASRKFAISRLVSMLLVGFVFLVFLLEVFTVIKREHLKMRSSVFAHLLILGFVLFALWYALGGAVI